MDYLFNFDQTELSLNQKGKLSAKQRDKLRRLFTRYFIAASWRCLFSPFFSIIGFFIVYEVYTKTFPLIALIAAIVIGGGVFNFVFTAIRSYKFSTLRYSSVVPIYTYQLSKVDFEVANDINVGEWTPDDTSIFELMAFEQYKWYMESVNPMLLSLNWQEARSGTWWYRSPQNIILSYYQFDRLDPDVVYTFYVYRDQLDHSYVLSVEPDITVEPD